MERILRECLGVGVMRKVSLTVLMQGTVLMVEMVIGGLGLL